MKNKIDIEMMRKISKSLMIEMTDEEIRIIMDQIKSSIDDLEKLNIFQSENYNLDTVDPMHFPNIIANDAFRKDVVKEFEHKKELLNEVTEIHNNLIKV